MIIRGEDSEKSVPGVDALASSGFGVDAVLSAHAYATFGGRCGAREDHLGG